MKKIILFSLSLMFSVAVFTSCDDDDDFSFNNNLVGEWNAVDAYVTADSLELVGYVFNADNTGSIHYNLHKENNIEPFSVMLKNLKFKSENQLSLNSQIFRVSYKEKIIITETIIDDSVHITRTIMRIPVSVFVNEDSYWSTTKHIKSLDGNSLVFTDANDFEEHQYTKIR